jgi:capsid protein
MFTPLTLKEKIQLQAHKAMCNTCNAYEAQSKLMMRIIGKWFITNSTQKKAALDEDKKKIIEEIRKI